MRVSRVFQFACLLSALFNTTAAAQTAQRVSLQASGIYSVLGGSFPYGSGPGFELQLRYNPSAFSIGAGYQVSNHSNTTDFRDGGSATSQGVFVEPRYVFATGNASMAPYASARFAVTSIEELMGYTINGGGGFLVRLTSRVNLDTGLTAGAFMSTGTSNGLLLGGGNAVARLGLAIGL